MNKIIKLICTCMMLLLAPACFSMEKVFYVLHNIDKTHKTSSNTLSNIVDNTKSINILISQAYHLDQHGVLSGFINPDLLALTHARSIKLMAMITNSSFDKDKSHIFLKNSTAQRLAIKSILNTCIHNHLYGVQFDFEMIGIKDKAALTHFYRMAADVLHQHNFAVSFAVPPMTSDGPFDSSYQRKLYKIFGGAYDLSALSKSADFLTIMAYDQHIGRMTPGPIAGIRWVEAVIKHTLKYVPSYKISLGIPAYSSFWYTGASSSSPSAQIAVQNNSISYEAALKIAKRHNVRLLWDDANQSHYVFYEHNWLNEYLFVEDARSLQAKIYLMKKYHLRGISFFRIGIEDPDIWNVLNQKT